MAGIKRGNLTLCLQPMLGVEALGTATCLPEFIGTLPDSFFEIFRSRRFGRRTDGFSWLCFHHGWFCFSCHNITPLISRFLKSFLTA